MFSSSDIQWTDKTWNPVVGCRSYSAGCARCYAETMSNRQAGMAKAMLAKGKGPDRSTNYLEVVQDGGWKGNVKLVPEALTDPFEWKKPAKVFFNSMSDLFYGDEADRKFCEAKGIPFEPVPFEFIDRVFAVMALTPQHTYQILTKRAGRMAEYMNEKWLPAKAQRIGDYEIPAQVVGDTRYDRVHAACEEFVQKYSLCDPSKDELYDENGSCNATRFHWPIPNLHLGVSVENQSTVTRAANLARCPAVVRFLSVEPMLEGILIQDALMGIEPNHGSCAVCGNTIGCECPGDGAVIQWLICGCESGPRRRPMKVDWAESLAAQCKAAGVPFFMKQMEIDGVVTGDIEKFPESLRIREFPAAGVQS